jgi:hypothetical protein
MSLMRHHFRGCSPDWQGEPKMSIPGVGWFAACTEPGGLLFGIMQADPVAM